VAEVLKSVARAIAAKRLFGRGEGILVAVSGGLDSMVLLHVLTQLAPAHDWRLTIAHFNHQLRGRSSDADERLVKRTAEKLGLPFVIGSADVRRFAREQKLSLEMAARDLRHGFLASAATKLGLNKIALAHHADDQVELFFLRLLRGAGGQGGAGMKWLAPSPADAKILLARPLLDQPKSALAVYAKQERVAFREDATNGQVDILRNRIRHELLPQLTKKFQPALTRVVLRQMEIVGAEAEFVTQTAEGWLKSKKRPAFDALPLAVQRRCVQLQLTHLGIAANFDLVEQLRESADRPVTVNKRLAVYRDTTGNLKLQEPVSADFDQEFAKVHLQGRAGEISFAAARIQWTRKSAPVGTFSVPKKRLNSECFDADKVGGDIVLRHWQPGDRFQPIGLSAPVKLQDLFTNAKISRERRHDLLVGTNAEGVLFWVEGLRLGECFKLDKNTRYQLNWCWKRL
jgi:tRNA(Ile)-lysidine synthase